MNKNRILKILDSLLALALLFSIFLLVYVAIRAPSRDMPLVEQLTRYGLPVGALLVFLTILRSLPDSLRARMTVALLSLATGLYGFETFLTIRQGLQLDRPYFRERLRLAREEGKIFDMRSQARVIGDLRASGTRAYPAKWGVSIRVETSNGIAYPLTGVAESTIVACNESGEYLIYKSDEIGLNNPKGDYELARMGALRLEVALVGDSFAHGECVPREKSIAGRIREVVPATLTFGVNGTGPVYSLAMLREYVSPLEPEVVLWLFFEGNDLEELNGERGHPELSRYLDRNYSQRLLEAPRSELDSGLRRFFDEMLEPAPLSWWLLRKVRAKLARSLEVLERKRDLVLFERVLAQARDLVGEWNGRLIFVYLPDHPDNRAPSPLKGRIAKIVDGLEIQFVDVGAAFLAKGSADQFFPFGLPGHYNEEGHRVAAEAILRLIRGGAQRFSNGPSRSLEAHESLVPAAGSALEGLARSPQQGILETKGEPCEF